METYLEHLVNQLAALGVHVQTGEPPGGCENTWRIAFALPSGRTIVLRPATDSYGYADGIDAFELKATEHDA